MRYTEAKKAILVKIYFWASNGE